MSNTADEVTEAMRRRADLLAGLEALHAWLRALPVTRASAAAIPGRVTNQLPVPDGLDHEQKLAWLEHVAAAWGTVTFPDGTGGRRAEKRFGPVWVVASVADPDRGVFGHRARAAALAAGSKAAA